MKYILFGLIAIVLISGCVQNSVTNTCAKEGGLIGSAPNASTSCCEGLTGISMQTSAELVPMDSLYCTKCGDGICKEPENKYNCPKDCNITNTTPATVQESNVYNIEISDYKFVPDDVTIKKGTTVVWTNVDPVSHTVSSSLLSKTSGKIESGGSWNYTFNTTGTWNYYCAYHWDKGKITVE